MTKILTCSMCLNVFKSQRALSLHQSKSAFCNTTITRLRYGSYFEPYPTIHRTQSHLTNYKSNEDKSQASIGENHHTFQWESESNSSANSGFTIVSNPFHYTNDIVHEINLLKIINDIGAPLYAYELIMKWARECYMSKYTFDSKHQTYDQAINYLENHLHFKICRPTIEPVRLCLDKAQANVVVFDVKKMLASLFDDPQLNKYKNLVVSSPNCFSKYCPPDNRYGEVNSGIWYNTAYSNCVDDPQTDFLCPIILASDKTTLSEIGDLHVDAIFLTTSLFNLKVSINYYFQ